MILTLNKKYKKIKNTFNYQSDGDILSPTLKETLEYISKDKLAILY